MNNKLLIAAAGAGKTTYLIEEALKRKNKALITTYTRSNEDEIRKKIYNVIGYIPSHIEIQTWFEFLLRQGVRPFQGIMDGKLFEKSIGFYLTEKKSIPYVKESKIIEYYFTKQMKIYSDKISKFIIRCNEKSTGKVISRITEIYNHIFIDEIQDLVGYDLDILQLFINSSSELLMVGDPRQTTYSTHPTDRLKKYRNGKIVEFINGEINRKIEICEVDRKTLNKSHRNNEKICSFSSKLFQKLPKSEPCKCDSCHDYELNHIGVFFVYKKNLSNYLEEYNPVQLRWNRQVKHDPNYKVYNFGESKGLSFDRVIIYPTSDMKAWLKNNSFELKDETRAKFYVAITRARKSVAIVVDDNINENNIGNECCFYSPTV